MKRIDCSLIALGLVLISGCKQQSAEPEAPSSRPRAVSAQDGASETEPNALSAEEAPVEREADLEGGPSSKKAAQAPADEADEMLSDPTLDAPRLSDPKQQEELFAANIGFTEAMVPEHLSCQGALPFRDAICDIAKRLCQGEQNATLEKKGDCETAQASCDSVRNEYKEHCGQ